MIYLSVLIRFIVCYCCNDVTILFIVIILESIKNNSKYTLLNRQRIYFNIHS
jgi:hypothetical protein